MFPPLAMYLVAKVCLRSWNFKPSIPGSFGSSGFFLARAQAA